MNFLAVGVVIFISLHVTLLRDSSRWTFEQLRQLAPVAAATPEQRLRKEQIRAGMSDVRKKSYIICASIFVHLVPLHPVQFILFENNGEDDAPKVAIKVAMLAGMYLQHLVVAAGFFRPNHRQVRWLSFGIYVYFTCFLVMTSPNLLDGKEVLQDALTNVKYAVISRFFLAIVFMDTELAVGGQLLISAVVVYTQSSVLPLAACIFDELNIYCSIILLSMILEFLLQSRVQALLDSAEAESMLSSFRRMLRGVCDGDILLDSNLQIQGSPECLKHLLMSTADMSGKDFNRLIASDEEESFQRFIAFSTSTAKNNSQADRHAPPCLRLSLRGSMDMRVAVDMFHVPLPNPSGAEEPYHLLAVREDAESRAPQTARHIPAPGVVPVLPRQTPSTGSRSSKSSSSSSSHSSKSSAKSCAWQNFPELAEMTLMVNVRTPQHNVEQVTLSCASPMFSLRKLAQPTDWETIRKLLESRADQAENGLQESGPGSIKKLQFRSPSGEKLCARDVEVEACRAHGAWRIRLRLTNFEKERHRSPMQGIHEAP